MEKADNLVEILTELQETLIQESNGLQLVGRALTSHELNRIDEIKKNTNRYKRIT